MEAARDVHEEGPRGEGQGHRQEDRRDDDHRLARVDELRERGVRAVLGNAANEEIMQLAHLECAKWLILTIPNGYEAGEIVASARAKNPDIEIIARAHYDDEVAYITERGANQVVMGEREIARTMLELLETPPAGEMVTG